jgi:hypothetical protein
VCVAMDSEERCASPSSDCPEECGDGAACVGGTCTPAIADPATYDLPKGVGLHASLLLMPDGRPLVVYYDRSAGDLYAAELVNGAWTNHPLDVGDDADTGMWADALVDDGGTLHVAYQDAVGDRLLYTTWSDGTAGTIEVVDDGVRADRMRARRRRSSSTQAAHCRSRIRTERPAMR